MTKEIKVGIIGFGTVGAGVAENLINNGEVIEKRTGLKIIVSKIADLDITTDRGVTVAADVLTTDAYKAMEEVDIVAELVGGTTIAKDFTLAALKLGKPVVTANKALLAEYGEELFSVAEENGVNIYYEASVAGGIPIIKGLREGLVSNRIERVYGIMNGTCNYILTRMENEGLDFEPILKDAQELGYAEAEPSLDVDGFDTAHKTAILASLAYGEWFGMDPIYVEGIRDVSVMDIEFAKELGYKIKLLAIIKEANGEVEVRVHPTLIPSNTMLGNISDVFNGVMVTGDTVDDTLFYGRGAGREATASAVVADIVDVALNLQYGSHRRVPAFKLNPQYNKLKNIDDIETRYYLRLQVADKVGVVAQLSKALGENNISISSIVQKETKDEESGNVSLKIITHKAIEKELKAAVSKIESLADVCDKVKIFRIEDI
ncbi:homoserine dehydrogenase [Lentisphaerota bacterium WC36G]|nr:homoserine dehydrogenase [Lentisphaerae bacterium WC36]